MAEADHSTTYLRPMPGSARMYPETDIPPSAVGRELVERLRANLPPPPEVRVATFSRQFGLGREEAQQIVAEGLESEFSRLAAIAEPSLAARALLAYLPELEKRHANSSQERLLAWTAEALGAVRAGRFAKEGMPHVLEALAAGNATTLEEAIRQTGLASVDRAQVEARARTLVQERIEFVRQRGEASAGPLMGVLMQEFRGRVDGNVINQVLKSEIERALAAASAKA
jgi:glutamyl-tRNA(Gln) amidotransferase subunit E